MKKIIFFLFIASVNCAVAQSRTDSLLNELDKEFGISKAYFRIIISSDLSDTYKFFTEDITYSSPDIKVAIDSLHYARYQFPNSILVPECHSNGQIFLYKITVRVNFKNIGYPAYRKDELLEYWMIRDEHSIYKLFGFMNSNIRNLSYNSKCFDKIANAMVVYNVLTVEGAKEFRECVMNPYCYNYSSSLNKPIEFLKYYFKDVKDIPPMMVLPNSTRIKPIDHTD